MKKIVLSVATIALLASCGAEESAVEAKDPGTATVEQVAQEETQKLVVNIAQSVVEWEGSKLAYGHTGTIKIQEGTLELTNGALTGGNFVIDMNSMEENNPDSAQAAKLIGHLKNGDFFKVDSFPTAELKLVKVDAGKVTADLTILGISKQIEFPATIEVKEGAVQATAEFTINRTDWGIVYGSGSFMDMAKDKAISDLISFKVKVEAAK